MTATSAARRPRRIPPAAVPSVGFVSLGCPKALVDSELILTQLRAEGYATSATYEDADLVIVNTCGFIDAAVQESLEAIGEALAENGKVIVTGCLGAKRDGGKNLVASVHPKVLAVTGPHATGEVLDHVHRHLPAGYLLNDESVEVLGRIAVSHARAGADVVAPSAMLDGMVSGIRTALDAAGFEHIPIMSYSAKFASGFYGPFRDAAQGAPQSGDRKSHQMDPANAREALRESELDVAEGADLLMVKPALPYLDIVRSTRDRFPGLPHAAYNVSGEYAMVKAAARAGWLEERRAVLEILTGIRRAGADLIITYHARDAARWLREG